VPDDGHRITGWRETMAAMRRPFAAASAVHCRASAARVIRTRIRGGASPWGFLHEKGGPGGRLASGDCWNGAAGARPGSEGGQKPVPDYLFTPCVEGLGTTHCGHSRFGYGNQDEHDQSGGSRSSGPQRPYLRSFSGRQGNSRPRNPYVLTTISTC
jgi:hypothetical protein